jgi:hypothetical protein
VPYPFDTFRARASDQALAVGPAPTLRLIALLGILVPSGWLSAQPWPRHTIDGTSRGADGVRLADVNGDGRLDIATGWEEGGVIRVYLQPARDRVREPWPAVTVGRVRSPEDAVLVDLDGDGAMDVVSCCEGKERTVFFHWSPGSEQRRLDADAWATALVPATAGRQMWMFATPADLDGRHGIDLAVGSKGENATISWLESPSDPRRVDRWRLHPLRTAGWIMSLVMHDMDDDGDQDILFSDRKGAGRGVAWLENPGRESVRAGGAWREHPIGGEKHEVMFLALGDLDADQQLDVVAATSRGPLLVCRRGGSAGPWTVSEIHLPANCGTGKSVAMGRIDGDERPDLVFTCENAIGPLSGVRWLNRDAGANRWRDSEIAGEPGAKYDRVELLDLDGDGDLDVLTCEERDNLGVIWYENPLVAGKVAKP